MGSGDGDSINSFSRRQSGGAKPFGVAKTGNRVGSLNAPLDRWRTRGSHSWDQERAYKRQATKQVFLGPSTTPAMLPSRVQGTR